MNKLFISIAIMTIATTAFAQSEQETVSSETAKNFSLPLSVAYILNPVYEKSYVNFSTSIAF